MKHGPVLCVYTSFYTPEPQMVILLAQTLHSREEVPSIPVTRDRALEWVAGH